MKAIDDYLESIKAPSQSWCSLLDRWESLVEDCEGGYNWSFYEFDNEALAREYLERLMRDSGLSDQVLSPVRDAVDSVDRRLKVLFQENVERRSKSPYWWTRGVLKVAGDEYVESMRALGLSVRRLPGSG